MEARRWFIVGIGMFVCISLYSLAGINQSQLITQQQDSWLTNFSISSNTNKEKQFNIKSYLTTLKKDHTLPEWYKYIATEPSYLRDSDQGSSKNEKGYWSWCTHLVKYGPNFDRGLATFISTILQPSNMLEFGAGIGLYINYVQRFSNKSPSIPNYIYDHGSNNNNSLHNLFIGIEPESMVDANIFLNSPNHAMQLAINIFNVSKTTLDSIPKFDVVFTSEVFEHIPFNLIDKFEVGAADFLVSKTNKFLIFGAARASQGGTGHLRESMKDMKFWIDYFKKKGLIHLPKLSERLRDFCYNGWDKGQNTFIMITKDAFNKEPNIEARLSHLKDVSDLFPGLQQNVDEKCTEEHDEN